MPKLIKFKNLGIVLEGGLVDKQGDYYFIRTPFRGENYVVHKNDIIQEEDEAVRVSYFSNRQKEVDVIDEFLNLEGKTSVDWFLKAIQNPEGSIDIKISIPQQVVKVIWQSNNGSEQFESSIAIEEQELNIKSTQRLKIEKISVRLGVVKVLFYES